MKATVISIINNKGGVGKTMTAQNLGAALALKGKKVCLIDFDSQHNLTNRYENEGRGEERLMNRDYQGIAIEDYLTDPSSEISPIEVKKNLHLIPATIRLAELSAVLYHMKANENPGRKLKSLCESMGEFFDFIIVDSEPGMSAVMVNATIAADMIIIPVSCMDALEGASEGVFGIMEKNGLDTDYYFLQTFYDEKQASSRNIRCRLLEEADGNYFNTRIKRNEWLNKAGEMGMDIFELMPKTTGANNYKELASEVIGKLKKKAK